MLQPCVYSTHRETGCILFRVCTVHSLISYSVHPKTYNGKDCINNLTHYYLTATIVTVSSKFRSQKRRDSRKNFLYELRVYESVDDESLS